MNQLTAKQSRAQDSKSPIPLLPSKTLAPLRKSKHHGIKINDYHFLGLRKHRVSFHLKTTPVKST
jgi:hypothetical protein